MPRVSWQGLAPPPALADALRRSDVQIDRSRVANNQSLVVFSASSRRIPIPRIDQGRWIWVCSAHVAAARKREAVLRGAYEVISLRDREAAGQLVARLEELSASDPAPPPSDTAVTESYLSRQLMAQVARVAPTSMAVLLTGESGVGKELVARAIHRASPRRLRNFAALNCAALPDDLVEAELFGHARGAFTGAIAERRGLFEEADGGTLFP